MQLGFDIDGVFADWNGAFYRALSIETGKSLNPTFESWNWDLAAGYTQEEINRTWKSHILDSPTFWRKLKLLPGTLEVGRQLNRLEKEGNGLYFITARRGYKPRVQTEEWLYKELGIDYPAVIVSASKTPILRSLGIEFFIDDKLENMLDFAPKGEYKQHLYLLDAPYNREGRPANLKVVKSVEEAMRLANLWTDIKTK